MLILDSTILRICWFGLDSTHYNLWLKQIFYLDKHESRSLVPLLHCMLLKQIFYVDKHESGSLVPLLHCIGTLAGINRRLEFEFIFGIKLHRKYYIKLLIWSLWKTSARKPSEKLFLLTNNSEIGITFLSIKSNYW